MSSVCKFVLKKITDGRRYCQAEQRQINAHCLIVKKQCKNQTAGQNKLMFFHDYRILAIMFK